MVTTIELLQNNKRYIIAAGLLLLLGFVIGAVLSDVMLPYIESELGKIQELGEKIAKEGSPFYASWVIFLNNLRAAIVLFILGSFIAIVPIFALLLNGVLIGVVMSMIGDAGVSPFLLFLFGIAPHGILEIPAIMIAGGLGLKLGIVLLKPLPELSRWESYRSVWKEAYKLSSLLVILLILAALIEGLITPLLIHMFIGDFGGL